MTKLKVLLALITKDNDYQAEQAAVAETAAQKLGIGLQVVYADGDAIAQTKQILAAVNAPEAERPNAIVVEPVGTGMPGVANAAVAHGIGWIVLNRESDYLLPLRQKATVPIGSIECDNVEVGRMQGRQFAALLPSGGRVLYIEGPPTDVTKQRRAGLDETVPANIQVLSARGKWTEESGNKAMASTLERQGSRPPDFGLIGCQNDAMAMGARKAVEALPAGAMREQWLKLPFTGVDGVRSSGMVWVQKHLLTATVVTPALTGTAFEMLAKAIQSGSQIPERTLTPVTSFPPLGELRRPA